MRVSYRYWYWTVSVVTGHWVAAGLATGDERVPGIPVGTFTHRNMTTCLTVRIHATLVLTRIDALIIATGTIIRTVFVQLALALYINIGDIIDGRKYRVRLMNHWVMNRQHSEIELQEE